MDYGVYKLGLVLFTGRDCCRRRQFFYELPMAGLPPETNENDTICHPERSEESVKASSEQSVSYDSRRCTQGFLVTSFLGMTCLGHFLSNISGGRMDGLIPLNITSTQTLKVEKVHTARFIGSGDLDVLATPMLIALMEAAALDTVQDYLDEDLTTVGIRVDIEHLRPTLEGEEITAEATLEKREGNSLEFWVAARDRFGMIGQGKHIRYIVNRKKFIDKARRNV